VDCKKWINVQASKKSQSNNTWFFHVRYVKNSVYIVKIRDLDHLQQRITAALATNTMRMLHHTWTETEYRLDVCRFRNCAHFEAY
jgi:hypothetical protein